MGSSPNVSAVGQLLCAHLIEVYKEVYKIVPPPRRWRFLYTFVCLGLFVPLGIWK